MDSVGLRKACTWIGNSPKIAMANYALLKSEDYLDASEKSDAAPPRIEENGGASSLENPIKTGVQAFSS
jgi:hypothetical protein